MDITLKSIFRVNIGKKLNVDQPALPWIGAHPSQEEMQTKRNQKRGRREPAMTSEVIRDITVSLLKKNKRGGRRQTTSVRRPHNAPTIFAFRGRFSHLSVSSFNFIISLENEKKTYRGAMWRSVRFSFSFASQKRYHPIKVEKIAFTPSYQLYQAFTGSFSSYSEACLISLFTPVFT